MKSRKGKPKARKVHERGRRQRQGHNNTASSAASRLRVASLLAKAGIPVVPLHGTKDGRCSCGNADCERPGGHPRTKNSLRDATSDLRAVTTMWAKWRRAKIGIVFGGASKLLAVEAEGDAGRRTLRDLAENHGGFQKTVTILDHDRRIRVFRCHQTQIPSRKIGDGVRILGDGKFVIAPSSLSGSTATRRFAKKRALKQVEIAQAPRWLTEIGAKARSDLNPAPLRASATCASDIKAEEVKWLWPGRIPLGKLSVIAGDPALGKSQLAAYLASAVSTGEEWPQQEGRAPQGSVLMLVAEDDPADTVVPRLKAAGADLSRIHIDCSAYDLSSDVHKLESLVRQLGDVRLIIIDPITAFVKSTIVQRAAADALQKLAARVGSAIVALSHLTKNGGARSPLAQVTGSLGLVAVARAAFLITEETGTDRRLFLPAKSSLASRPTGLAYRIQPATSEGIVSSTLTWDPLPVGLTVDEAMASRMPRKAYDSVAEGVDFLRLLLSSEGVPAKPLRAEAVDAGISLATLRRAASKLGVKRRRVGGIAGNGYWIWELPDTSATDRGELTPRLIEDL